MLRAEHGLSIDQLAARLSLSRSTVNYWVRDLPIPGSGPGGGFSSEARRKAALVNQTKARDLREASYAEGRDLYPAMISEPTFRDFVCLYLAEGFKRDRTRVSVCNSDPAIVAVCLKWIRVFSNRPIKYSIQYHADQNLADLRAFWGSELGIDGDAIAFQRKSNSNQLTGRAWRSPYGVLYVCTCDTYFRARLQAWMDLLRAEWV